VFSIVEEIRISLGAGRVAQMVAHLLSKYEVPDSNPSTIKKKKRNFTWDGVFTWGKHFE
jgi:hypothetical protein